MLPLDLEPDAHRVTAVIPTLGLSRWLGDCVEALRRESAELEILVVCPAGTALPDGLAADRVLETSRPLGFAAATGAGFAASASAWLATVNDDVVVEPGWLEALSAQAARHPGAGALQGVNLRLDEPTLVDGCGLAWNRWLQAVQIDHLRPAPAADAPVREIFGVSATAALYRRSALEQVAPDIGRAFDPLFHSYYEDVDLALRLRARGWEALEVPRARARHAASTTGGRHPFTRARLTTGNRLLALRRALGGGFWRELPQLAGRDALDALRAAGRGAVSTSTGIAAGWLRAAWRVPRLAKAGAHTTAAELRAWSASR